jgi:hypothetical protein
VPSTQEELAALEASYQPFHGAASWRRVRVDNPRWTRYAHILARRVHATSADTWLDVQDSLLRAAALESGALDGLFAPNPELTTTVLSSSVSPPAADGVAGKVELIAECHRRALILASEAAADGRAVSENLMAVLQDVITESQATYTVTTDQGQNLEVDLPRRQYKPVSNYLMLPHGRLAVFAPASRVAPEMNRLASELASAEFGGLHPAVQAAYAHYAMTAIHPFADGNGRLARVVASIFLLRSVGVPLLVFADQWPAYYQALGYHGLGSAQRPADRQQLSDYVCAAAVSAMDIAANLLARSAHSGPRAVRQGRAGRVDQPPRSALDVGARALLDSLAIELRELLVSPPPGVRLAIAGTRTMPAGHVESAYRVVADSDAGSYGIRVAVHAQQRAAQQTADLEFVPLASELPNDLLPIAVREIRTGELFEVALADAHPLVLESTVVRIRLWAQRLVEEVLAPTLNGPARRRFAEHPAANPVSSAPAS